MTTRTLRTLAVLILTGTATSLGACTVYDAGPSYPAGYYYSEPTFPRYYSAPNVYFGFRGGHGWGGHGWHGHHDRWYGRRGWH